MAAAELHDMQTCQLACVHRQLPFNAGNSTGCMIALMVCMQLEQRQAALMHAAKLWLMLVYLAV